MTENTNRKQIPTPADLDPNRASREQADAQPLQDDRPWPEPVTPRPASKPTPAAVSSDATPIHRVPVVELSNEQRTRVEALHAARRVLGNPHTREGQIPAGWSWQAIELANYILTGAVDCGHAEEDEPAENTDDPAHGGPYVVDLTSPLPADMPPALAEKVEQFRAAARKSRGPSAEDRAQNTRDYVAGYLDKPDGIRELHAQGFYPVSGSEPPRSEPLHDVHCRRWTFSTATGQWKRDSFAAEESRRAGEPLFGHWGPALAEFGPFHVCV